MVRHIIAGAIFRYTKILNTYQASATLNVRYRDISSALTKLSIPMGYVVLVGSIGTHLLPDGFDNNPDVHLSIPNNQRLSLLIRVFCHCVF